MVGVFRGRQWPVRRRPARRETAGPSTFFGIVAHVPDLFVIDEAALETKR
jgi:hypothetical protein